MIDSPVSHDSSTPSVRSERSLSLARVNFLSIPIGIVCAVVAILPFLLLWGPGLLGAGSAAFLRPLSLVPAFIVGLVGHEALHAVGWLLAGRKPLRTIRFGFKVSTLTPFAHCTEPIPARVYRLGAVLPSLALGMAPIMAGWITGNGWLLCFGLLFLIAASGDFLVLWLMRDIPGDWMVEDHPHRAGCVVYGPSGQPTANTQDRDDNRKTR